MEEETTWIGNRSESSKFYASDTFEATLNYGIRGFSLGGEGQWKVSIYRSIEMRGWGISRWERVEIFFAILFSFLLGVHLTDFVIRRALHFESVTVIWLLPPSRGYEEYSIMPRLVLLSAIFDCGYLFFFLFQETLGVISLIKGGGGGAGLSFKQSLLFAPWHVLSLKCLAGAT